MKLIVILLITVFFLPVGFAGGMYGNEMQHPGVHSLQVQQEFRVRSEFRLQRFIDERGYVLRILLAGIAPEAIEVVPVRNSLLIRTEQSKQTTREEQAAIQSYSQSFSMHRRVPLPRDADIDRMQRTDSEKMIEIVLPRRR